MYFFARLFDKTHLTFLVSNPSLEHNIIARGAIPTDAGILKLKSPKELKLDFKLSSRSDGKPIEVHEFCLVPIKFTTEVKGNTLDTSQFFWAYVVDEAWADVFISAKHAMNFRAGDHGLAIIKHDKESTSLAPQLDEALSFRSWD